jgi:hypothetical protein
MSHKKTNNAKRTKTKNNKRKFTGKTIRMKRGGEETPKCCMCRKKVHLKDSLVPSACLVKHGKRAHRICQDCWWDETRGFAREHVNHNCPGCRKSHPLTKVKQIEEEVVIDLTGDE